MTEVAKFCLRSSYSSSGVFGDFSCTSLGRPGAFEEVSSGTEEKGKVQSGKFGRRSLMVTTLLSTNVDGLSPARRVGK